MVCWHVSFLFKCGDSRCNLCVERYHGEERVLQVGAGAGTLTRGIHGYIDYGRIVGCIWHEVCQGTVEKLSQHHICNGTNGEVAYVHLPLLLVIRSTAQHLLHRGKGSLVNAVPQVYLASTMCFGNDATFGKYWSNAVKY